MENPITSEQVEAWLRDYVALAHKYSGTVILNVTASQRAEAFGQTLGLW